MEITKSPDVIGAEISGVDLAQPLAAEAFDRIEEAFNEHAVLCFRRQSVNEEQLIAFARRFGEIAPNFLPRYMHPSHPEIMFVSNIKETTTAGPSIGA